MANETRFGILKNIAPERAQELAVKAQVYVREHYALYQQMAMPADAKPAAPVPVPAQPQTPAQS